MPLPSTILVAILTYNRSSTAATSINSIALNSDKNVEIIVFDDGSSLEHLSSIRSVCALYPNLTLVESQSNQGYAKNLLRALHYMATQQTDLSFLCESDMLLCPNWPNLIRNAFYFSPESVALSPMLHKRQLEPDNSERFRQRCLHGQVLTSQSGHITEVKTPFGSSYTALPDHQTPIKTQSSLIRYVSNSVGTLAFRTSFLRQSMATLTDVLNYPSQEDAWISWLCFYQNNFSPKSLMALDPGIAFTFGEEGLHGPMQFSNLRWAGSFFWRYPYISTVTSYFFLLRWFLRKDTRSKISLIEKKLLKL